MMKRTALFLAFTSFGLSQNTGRPHCVPFLRINELNGKGDLITTRNETIGAGVPAGAPPGTIDTSMINSPNDRVNVMAFGAKCDGSTDDTKAFRAAVAGITSGAIFVPNNCRITDTIRVQKNGVVFQGQGMSRSVIHFSPAADGVAFRFDSGASPALASNRLAYAGLNNLSIVSTERAYKKTAILVVNNEEAVFENVNVHGFTDVSGSSKGFVFWGGQEPFVRNIISYADWPLLFEDNAILDSSIRGIDHFTFQNTYFSALTASNPNVYIGSGLEVADLTFSGTNAWTKGTDGLRWDDGTTTTASMNVVIENVRWEQGSGGYAVKLNRSGAPVQGFNVRNFRSGAGATTKGYYLRRVYLGSLQNVQYAGSSEALNIDGTVATLDIRNCLLGMVDETQKSIGTGVYQIADSSESSGTTVFSRTYSTRKASQASPGGLVCKVFRLSTSGSQWTVNGRATQPIAAARSQRVTLALLPARSVVTFTEANTSVAWAATGVTSLSTTVGDEFGGTTYYQPTPYDMLAAPSETNFANSGTIAKHPTYAARNLIVVPYTGAGGPNLNAQVLAGATDFTACWVVMP